MEQDKTVDGDETGSTGEADMVESGGETVAAATGAAEIGAAKGEMEDEAGARPVGADTRVKVAGERDSEES